MRKVVFLSILILSILLCSCASKASPAVLQPDTVASAPAKTEGIVGELADLAARLIPEEAKAPKNNFALLTLSSDDGNVAEEEYLSDALLEAIFNTKLVKIYERDHLQTLLDEQKLQSTGYFDETTAKEIGLLAGVDYIAYGTIRDAGDEVTINARVVDVVNGEICAMSRATVQKDSYLKTLASGVSETTASVTPAKVAKDYTNLWLCTRNRNAFDEYTTYTFLLKGPGDHWLFFGYDKFDDVTKSLVRAGVYWGSTNIWVSDYTGGTYDFKKNDGTIVTKDFKYAFWSKDTGWKDGDDIFGFAYNNGESARFFMDLFMNNDILTVRHGDTVQRFQTAGFLDALKAEGITMDEIENAIANEEF